MIDILTWCGGSLHLSQPRNHWKIDAPWTYKIILYWNLKPINWISLSNTFKHWWSQKYESTLGEENILWSENITSSPPTSKLPNVRLADSSSTAGASLRCNFLCRVFDHTLFKLYIWLSIQNHRLGKKLSIRYTVPFLENATLQHGFLNFQEGSSGALDVKTWWKWMTLLEQGLRNSRSKLTPPSHQPDFDDTSEVPYATINHRNHRLFSRSSPSSQSNPYHAHRILSQRIHHLT